MRRIRKGDEVIVIAGKDKGRHGKVMRVMKDDSVLMAGGVNLIKRHTKPNPSPRRGWWHRRARSGDS
jgi:large subunit ribosomal protein L24